MRAWTQPPENSHFHGEIGRNLPLVGASVLIRRFDLEDEDLRQQWAKFSDPFLAKYNFSPCSRESNVTQFEKLKDRIRLAVDDRQERMIGYISLKPIPSPPRSAELGICFAADQVNKGYGGETLRLVLPWASRHLGLERIRLEVDDVNQRAICLYQRLGFRQRDSFWKREDCSTLKAHILQNGLRPGFRWQGRHLEVLTWMMEWRPNLSAD